MVVTRKPVRWSGGTRWGRLLFSCRITKGVDRKEENTSMWAQTKTVHPAQHNDRSWNRVWGRVRSSPNPALSELLWCLSPNLLSQSSTRVRHPWPCPGSDGGGKWGSVHSSSILQWILLLPFSWSFRVYLPPPTKVETGLVSLFVGSEEHSVLCVCVCLYIHINLFSWGIIYKQ